MESCTGGVEDDGALSTLPSESQGRVMQKALGLRKPGIRGRDEKHPKGYWSERCPHNRTRRVCKDCGGTGLCEHGRQKSICKMCGGKSICEHNRRRNRCKTCGGSSICPHNKHRPFCKDCGGSQICEHGRHKNRCVDCGGSGICVHKRHKYRCWECKEAAQCMHKQPRKTCDDCRMLREAGPENMAVKIHDALTDLEKEGLLPEQLLPDGDPRKHSLTEMLKSLRTVAFAFVPAPRLLQPQPQDAHDKSSHEDAEPLHGRDTRHIQQKLATQMYFTREHMALHSRHLHYHPEAAAGCIEGLSKQLATMQRQHDAQVAFLGGKSREAACAGLEAPAMLHADKDVTSPSAEAHEAHEAPPSATKPALSSDPASQLRPNFRNIAASGDASAPMHEASPGPTSSWTGVCNGGWSPGGWGGGWGSGAAGGQPACHFPAWPGNSSAGLETARYEGKGREDSKRTAKSKAASEHAQVSIPFTHSHPAQGYPFGPPPDLHWAPGPQASFPVHTHQTMPAGAGASFPRHAR